MKRFAKLLSPLAAALVLSGCAGMELERAQNLTPEGSAFNMSLYKGYVELAESEHAETDYADSDVFAQRAIGAGSGQAVEPELIDRRALPEDKVAELTGARQRLTSALSAGAAERKPAEAAHAQVMFDCWMQEQEENFQPEDIARCRAALMASLDALEVLPTAKAVPGPYVVFFDFDKAELTERRAGCRFRQDREDFHQRPYRPGRRRRLQRRARQIARRRGRQVPDRERCRQGEDPDRRLRRRTAPGGHAGRPDRAQEPSRRDQLRTLDV
jgi:hypothetical protein